MKDAKTGEEVVINQPLEPKESQVEENAAPAAVEPALPADQEPAPLTDAEILAKLQPKVEKAETPSRKEKAIERSVKNFNQALDEEGAIIFPVLIKEYDKNPKGLESFAKANGYELSSLKDAIEGEKAYINSEYEEKINGLNEKLSEYSEKEAADKFQSKIKTLVKESDLTLRDFQETYGEDFNLFVTAYTQQGKTSQEAIELAYKKVVPAKNLEKLELLDTEKVMPIGKKAVKSNEPTLMTSAEVQALPDAERYAYKAKFRNSNTKVVRYA